MKKKAVNIEAHGADEAIAQTAKAIEKMSEFAPNVKFVGMKTIHGEQVKKEVPPFVMVGRTKIVLPVVEHGESFFSPHASLLIGSSRDFVSCLASK